jgi:outer membrane protein
MKKLLLVPALLVSFLASVSAFAVEGLAVIDMRTAVLATQVSKATFTALEEESEYAGNVEQAQLLQADRQAIAEKLQKDGETLSQAEIKKKQKDIQDKSKDLEFIVGKIQAKQNDTAEQVFNDLNPSLQKILSELIAAKEVKVLLGRDQVLFADAALDLTDDVTSMLDVAAADGADKK